MTILSLLISALAVVAMIQEVRINRLAEEIKKPFYQRYNQEEEESEDVRS